LQRIESGRQNFSFEPVDLVALVKQEIDQLELAKVSQPSIHVETEPVPLVLADVEALRRLIRNLISNAFKFSPDREIEISVRMNGSHVRFSIRDHGIGIPPDELKHLFERFYRGAAAESQRVQGTRLGRALCPEIVEAHHGHIWAESDGEGQGATFHFTLPTLSDKPVGPA
jgi:two-component system, OmpR family, sensor histidine kinase VicK